MKNIARRVTKLSVGLLIVLVIAKPSMSQTEPSATAIAPQSSPVVDAYRQHRQGYLNGKAQIKSEISQKVQNLEAKIDKTNSKIGAAKEKISTLKGQNQRQSGLANTIEYIKRWLIYIFSPVLGLASLVPAFGTSLSLERTLSYIFIPLTMINILFYLVVRERPFFKRYGILIVVSMILLLAGMTSPLYAQEQQHQSGMQATITQSSSAQIIDKYDRINNKMDLVGKLLTLSDHQRFIEILKSKLDSEIYLPNIASGDDLLIVYRTVRSGTAEYYMTLAALHAYLNEVGFAVDALKKMLPNTEFLNSDNVEKIIINTIHYLIKQQDTAAAADFVEQYINRLSNVDKLLSLATFLNEKQMQSSSERVLNQAINSADSVNELLRLANYFYDSGQLDNSNNALDMAMSRANRNEEYLAITETALKLGKNDLIKQQLDRLNNIKAELDVALPFIDLFLKMDRREEAIIVMNGLITRISVNTDNGENRLLAIFNASLSRSLISQAADTVEKLAVYMKRRAYEYSVTLDSTITASLPDPGPLNLPLISGILNEELKYYDKAESRYSRAAQYSLDNIIDSFGYSLPSTLNEFALLGNAWINNNNYDSLSKLDAIYTALENKLLNKQREIGQKALESNQQTIAELQNTYDDSTAEIARLELLLKQERKEILLETIHTTSIALFLLAVLIGCLIKAWQYTERLSQNKATGFLSKFIESLGWVNVMSVISFLTGIFMIVFGQLIQIFQNNQESNKQAKEALKNLQSSTNVNG